MSMKLKRAPAKSEPAPSGPRSLDPVIQRRSFLKTAGIGLGVGAMASLEFDIAIPGHGAIGTKQDISAYQRYFEDLQAAVTRGIEAGASVAELQQTIRLDAYQDWDRYDSQLAVHIGEAYENMVSRSVGATD